MIEELLDELRRRGWTDEDRSVEIHLDHDSVRVELRWNEEPGVGTNTVLHSTMSFASIEGPTLRKALVGAMKLAVAAPEDDG